MTSQQITLALNTLFKHDPVKQKRKLVFWYDSKREFEDMLDELPLDNTVKKIRLNGTPFKVKYKILVEEPETSFLIYAPFAEPRPEDNWLLDLLKQAERFAADLAEVRHKQLGFYERELVEYVREHISFFRSEKRIEALKALGVDESAKTMDLRLAVMCAVARLRSADASLLVRGVLMGGLSEANNALWQELNKYLHPAEFWLVVEESLGFRAENPTLRELFIRLAATHLNQSLNKDSNETLPLNLLPKLIQPSNKAHVFVDNWLHYAPDNARWEELAAELAPDLGITEWTEALAPASYMDAETFETLDQTLIRNVVTVLGKGNANHQDVSEWLSARKPLYFYEKYQFHYAALEAANILLERLPQVEAMLSSDPTTLFYAYAEHLYTLDQSYRHYVAASDQVHQDILKPLTDAVERAYTHGFLHVLGEAWTVGLEELSGVWSIPDVKRQWRFYEEFVRVVLDRNDREKVFVVVSDAVRYEVAEELRDRLVQDLRGEATLTPVLGVLPSITKLGMAALLPGEELEFVKHDVLKGGFSTQGTENRQAILTATGHSSLAVKADVLIKASQTEGRELIKPHRLIYVYHDQIDAVGDHTPSEGDVFAACEQGLLEVTSLVKKIVNGFNGTHVVVTSDHGFLYQRQPLADYEKVKQPKGDILDSGRRHVVGTDIEEVEGTQKFRLPFLQDGVEACVPRGTLRYALQGAGAQYVHGGASLQEVCVPVLSYKHVRAKGDEGPSRKVGVHLNATTRKVTNNHFTIRLVQAEPIGERLRSRQVIVKFVDEAGRAITNEFALNLDSSAQQATDREYIARLSINVGDSKLGQGRSYYLVVVDKEDNLDVIREPWQVSIAFTDDFSDL